MDDCYDVTTFERAAMRFFLCIFLFLFTGILLGDEVPYEKHTSVKNSGYTGKPAFVLIYNKNEYSDVCNLINSGKQKFEFVPYKFVPYKSDFLYIVVFGGYRKVGDRSLELNSISQIAEGKRVYTFLTATTKDNFVSCAVDVPSSSPWQIVKINKKDLKVDRSGDIPIWEMKFQRIVEERRFDTPIEALIPKKSNEKP